jgi:hypothetical protein
LRFRGRKHEHALPAHPRRFHDLTLWHLNLVLLSPEERRAKVEHNRAQLPGLVAAGGLELNQAYYRPEDAHDPPTEPVPEPDLALVRAMLAAAPTGEPRPAEVPLGTRAEIEPLWAERPLDPDELDGAVAPLSPEPLAFAPGEHRTIYLRVRNRSCERWPWGLEQAPLVRLGSRWDSPTVPEGRFAFPCEVPPGEERIVPVAVLAPEAPGRHSLLLGLLLEGVRWFGDPCVLNVTVG